MAIARTATQKVALQPLDLVAMTLLVALTGWLATHACCVVGSGGSDMPAALARICGGFGH